MSNPLLIDTDAFCKLGVAGILSDAGRVFDVELHDFRRLPALTYMLRKGRLRTVYGEEACDSLILIAAGISVLNEPSLTSLDKLTQLEEIDPGEVQLFAAASESHAMVLTGDKRSLRVLKEVEGIGDLLNGRIAVFEAVLIALLDVLGDEQLRRNVSPLMESDKVTGVCFSKNNPDPGKCLISYYTELVKEVSPLVLWNPRAT